MPRQAARKQVLNFVGGLITEASPLTFPENTAKDLDNVDLNRDGSVRRRRGINFEALGKYSSDTWSSNEMEEWAISVHEWKSVGGNDELNFLVVQVGRDLLFYQLGATVLSTTFIGRIQIVNIANSTDYDLYPISATAGKGKLFIVSRAINPSYIEYDEDSNTFDIVQLTLKVRDIDGIDEDGPTTPIGGFDGSGTNFGGPFA